nr:hypothetical protein pPsy0462a_00091 [Pseudomonas syringae]
MQKRLLFRTAHLSVRVQPFSSPVHTEAGGSVGGRADPAERVFGQSGATPVAPDQRCSVLHSSVGTGQTDHKSTGSRSQTCGQACACYWG